jgi:hypothetical protein
LNRRVLTAAVVAALSFLALPAVGEASFHFLPAAQVAGPPLESSHALIAMDCPNAKLCVGGDDSGNIVASAVPTGGAGSWSLFPQVDPPGASAGVSCPSASLCVDAGRDGDIAYSRHPASPNSWKLVTGVASAANGLRGIACPSAKLCVALDGRGDVLISRQPTGSRRSWKSTRALTKKNDWLLSISCPSTSECVAIDRFGHTVTHSTKPTGGRRAWHTTTVATKSSIFSADTIACPSKSLCLIAGLEGGAGGSVIVTTTHPTGSSKAWKVSRRLPSSTGALTGISCPSRRFCMAIGEGASVLYSTNPAGGAKTFKRGFTPASPRATGVACASASLCTLFGSRGQVIVSTSPKSSASSAWSMSTIDAYNSLTSVACPSSTLCVAGGSRQAVFASANPVGGPGTWTAQALTIAPGRVACASSTLCVGGDSTSGDLAASTTPLSGGWNVADTNGDLPDGGTIAVLACNSSPFCMAGPYEIQSDSDDEGTTALTSTNPAGGTSAWNYSSTFVEGGVNGGGHPAKGTIDSLACPSAVLCVAGDARGGIVVSVSPQTELSWKYSRPDGTAAITGMSCPSSALCVGVDSQGRALTSTNPVGGTWKRMTIDAGFPLTAVSCASTTFCVTVDGHRHAVVSTNPTGGASAWRRLSGIDGDLTSISCQSSSLCVAVDSQGNATVGES